MPAADDHVPIDVRIVSLCERSKEDRPLVAVFDLEQTAHRRRSDERLEVAVAVPTRLHFAVDKIGAAAKRSRLNFDLS